MVRVSSGNDGGKIRERMIHIHMLLYVTVRGYVPLSILARVRVNENESSGDG